MSHVMARSKKIIGKCRFTILSTAILVRTITLSGLSVRVELPELAQDEAVINLDFNDDSSSDSVSDDSDSE